MRGVRIVLVSALGLLVTGCAKKGPPTGGPPDIEPPRLVGSSPDSGAARVALDARPSLHFSEGMEPRSTTDAVEIVPRIEIEQQRWSGSTLTLVPKDEFKANTTYTLFLSPSARLRLPSMRRQSGSSMRVRESLSPPSDACANVGSSW